MKLLFALILAFVPKLAEAQSLSAIYFDSEWKETSKSNAIYYRETNKLREGLYEVNDFYIDGRKLMTASCSSVDSVLVFHGSVTWFHENGQIKAKGLCKNNRQVGLWNSYHKNGRQKELTLHKGDTVLYCQRWMDDATPLLTKGTGRFQEETNELIEVSVIQDSLMIASFSINKELGDTLYTKTEYQARYRGGMRAFYTNVGRVIKYPAYAKKHGIEGKVLVQITIGKNGEPEQLTVLKGIEEHCNAEAIRAVREAGRWIPARHKGVPVRQRVVVPISFTLY